MEPVCFPHGLSILWFPDLCVNFPWRSWNALVFSFYWALFTTDMIDTTKDFSIINEVHHELFLVCFAFSNYLVCISNKMSCSSAFLKPSWSSCISFSIYDLCWMMLSIILLPCEIKNVIQCYKKKLCWVSFLRGRDIVK